MWQAGYWGYAGGSALSLVAAGGIIAMLVDAMIPKATELANEFSASLP